MSSYVATPKFRTKRDTFKVALDILVNEDIFAGYFSTKIMALLYYKKITYRNASID